MWEYKICIKHIPDLAAKPGLFKPSLCIPT